MNWGKELAKNVMKIAKDALDQLTESVLVVIKGITSLMELCV